MFSRLAQSAVRILAVVRADLRALSRARGYGIERSLFAGALLAAVALSWPRGHGPADSIRELSRFGSEIFEAFFYTAYVATWLLVPALFGGAFSAERAGPGAQILFTTPLGPVELTAGRFVSRYLRFLLLLACGVPVLFSSLLFGGVSGAQMLAALTALLVLAFLAGALTVLVSALSGKGTVAGGATLVALLGHMAAVGIVVVVLDKVIGFDLGAGATFAAAPQLGLGFLPFADMGADWGPVAAVVVALVSGTLLLGVTMLILRPLTLHVPVEKPARRKAPKAPSSPGAPWSALAPPGAVGYRGPVWRNPVAWKEFRVRPRRRRWLRRILWALVLFFAGLWSLFMMTVEGDIAMLHSMLFTFATLLLGILGTFAASTAIAREHEEGRLELLAVTPLAPGAFAAGKALGVVRALAPLLVVVALDLFVWGTVSLLAGTDGTSTYQRNPVFLGPFEPIRPLVPVLAAYLVVLATGTLVVLLGLVVSSLARKASHASVLGIGALLAWWAGVPGLFLLLDMERYLDPSGGLNPLFLAARWSEAQRGYSYLRDLHTPTLIFLGFAAVASALLALGLLLRTRALLGRGRHGRIRVSGKPPAGRPSG